MILLILCPLTSKFADVYLNSVKDYYQLLATIYFLTHHPAVNEQILDYSITITLVHRDDTSLEVANPLEVHLLSIVWNNNKKCCSRLRIVFIFSSYLFNNWFIDVKKVTLTLNIEKNEKLVHKRIGLTHFQLQKMQ